MSAPAPVLLLDQAAVEQLLTLDDCIDAVEAAFAAHARGNALAPELAHVDAEGGEFHIKAGGLKGRRSYFVCKINGGFFGNRARFGLPNIVGLLLLCDAANGCPLSIMESGRLTCLRTAAATAIAARYLARKESATVTLCGAGKQGEAQLQALTRVLPIKRVLVWGRSDTSPFAARMSAQLGLDVRAVDDLVRAARASDVIVTCTPSTSWYLGRQHVSPGTFVAAMGTDSPDKQEIEPELLSESSVVVDLLTQSAKVGDLHHALNAHVMNVEQVRGELGAIIVGRAPQRSSASETIIFDSTGTALQDAAAAALVYERALAGKVGMHFSFWS